MKKQNNFPQNYFKPRDANFSSNSMQSREFDRIIQKDFKKLRNSNVVWNGFLNLLKCVEFKALEVPFQLFGNYCIYFHLFRTPAYGDSGKQKRKKENDECTSSGNGCTFATLGQVSTPLASL